MTQNLPAAGDTGRVDDELLIDEEDILTEANDGETIEDAEKAVERMVEHERRRSDTYRTGGDDYDAGIDEEIDGNAPSEVDKD